VVGKFAPLHRGHELVIRRALAECAEVVILSYSSPELPGCEPERRERWLAEIFPEAKRLVLTDARLAGVLPGHPDWRALPPNDADGEIHRRFVAAVCLDGLGVTVDAVFTSEDYGDAFAATLTACFRARNPRAPAVAHVCVDVARQQVPISGTAIRADVDAHREWLSPAVRASFVRRVCLLGGESSGKTTLAQALARDFATSWVPEYGRELWEARGGALELDDLLRIAETQVVREEAAALTANRVLFCDTSPLTTLLYCRHLFGGASAALETLAARPYDLVVLCAPDFPFVQDGTREPPAFRDWQHDWYLEALAERGIGPLLVTGDLAARRARVRAALEERA
jgi:NadR type nicotinamide-nucleotide adenylyltransferase